MRMTCFMAWALILSPTVLGHQTQNAARLRRPAINAPGEGVIIGYVYWDGNLIKHQPTSDCSGLSVTVNWGNSSSGALASNLTYIPNVGTDGVCAYAVHGVPVGQDLQVQANVTASATFIPAALPSGDSKSIKIMGGNALCNNLPPAVPSPSVLSANWWTCPNYAYNVNFTLVRAPGSLSSRVAGPVRVAPGTAVELSPQPYPPKNATLLAPGEQKTLLGDGGVQQSGGGTLAPSQTLSAQGNAGSNAGSAPIPPKVQGRTEYEPVTVERGVTQDKDFAKWANSGHAPAAIQENPNVYVAQACAKDTSFRILLVSGASDGKTLTVGPQYTVWGCSFGNMPAVKRPTPPVTPQSQNQTASYPSNYNVSVWTSQPFIDIDARIVSWSDNAIVVTFPSRPANHPGPSTAGDVLPSQLLLTRGDAQTRIYGGEGGLYFRLTN